MTYPHPRPSSTSRTETEIGVAGLEDLARLSMLGETTGCADPQAAYARLRERWGGPVVPVLLEPGVPAWLALDYELVLELVTNEQLYSRNPRHWRLFAEGRVRPDSGLAPMMFPRPNAYFLDGAEHRRLRCPLVDALAQVDEYGVDAVVRDICDRLLAPVLATGRADLIAGYAAQVPMLTIAALFGLDTTLRERLQRCLLALFGSGADSQAGNEDLEHILTGVISGHRAAPAPDMTTVLVQHQDLRGDAEIQQSMVLMLSAGWETVQVWIARALWLVLTDVRFATQWRGGRLGIDQALAEVLWRDPPMANMPARYARDHALLGGRRIQRGDAVILGLAAANADPRLRTGHTWLDWDNHSHLAFSAGPHACPARRLAHRVARTAVETALRRLPGLHLAVPAAHIPLHPSPWTRGPAALPVRFTVDSTPHSQEETHDAFPALTHGPSRCPMHRA
ncbi:cytochrome P450 [Saccharothrix sp. AJ9571]|nr:cytochrome P450 [Saccharothrix sp. AJ9571]